MASTKFANILLDKSPKKINNAVERILDILFKINEIIREINSIDFCNPLGYILTKALPPGGRVDTLLKEYGQKVTKFVNKVDEKTTLNSTTSEISDDLEEIRLLLEELIPDPELQRIIPGGDGILNSIQTINDSLVITNTILSVQDKKLLLKTFTQRLIPFMNPISITEALLKNQADDLNKTLRDIIKPERFRSSLLSLIKLVISIDKSIAQIESIVLLMNKIIKVINVLIKVFTITITILKLLPMPAKYVTVGVTVTASSKVSKMETDIKELEKLLDAVSTFLNNTVIIQIQRIRREIFTLLVGLNQLYENLSACSYFENDIILNEIEVSITTLENNIVTLETLFPSISDNEGDLDKNYKGYKIKIINEETTDNNTSLFRRRVIVVNNKDIIEYEGDPTYGTDTQILIKEGQYYIDQQEGINTSDSGNNNIDDEQTQQIMNRIGLDTDSVEKATNKSNKVNEILKEQINQNPNDKELFELVNGDNQSPNPKRIKTVEGLTNMILSRSKNPLIIQNRLKQMSDSLLRKGFTDIEVNTGIKNIYKKNESLQIN